MPYYSVVFVTPKSDAWIPDYVSTVAPLVAKHGGKYLARTTSHERLEGDSSPAVIAILEFSSKEAATAFYKDPAYQPPLKARLEGADNSCYLVEGKDDFA